ncbi:hypothetical protein CRUP_004850 [Coryphaenoides rupestris]|nr:hypothetical protein CRUP_004850 [Coryphaenoides rupestris]
MEELSAAETNAQPGTVLQRSVVGGNKPLHRFMKGQPKVIGIILLMMGSSLFILSLPMHKSIHQGVVQPGFWLGPMVTACLAVSIVALLAALWVSLLHLLPLLIHGLYIGETQLVMRQSQLPTE